MKCPENIKLIEPVVELESEFFAMVDEFAAEGDTSINGIGSIDVDDFVESVSLAKRHAEGIDLPEEWVPCSTYWLVCENHIVGTCSLRHELNDFLKNYGGHIGYSIRPSERGKGYGTKMLELTLEKARSFGVERALVTCHDCNMVSARIIEKNGGELADTVKTEYSEFLTRRYWIDLAI